MRRLLFVLIFIWGSANAGEPLVLSLPVDCVLGESCFVQNHFDRDPGPGFRDYAGGRLGYDGHDGLDIRVPDLPAMARGVAVVAAAAGRVQAVRDGMADIDARLIDAAAIAGRDAGNSVVIDHGGEWRSQYSHLRMGSVTVKPGDVVAAGDVLGMIGMSGNAAFPHVHFAVRRDGVTVDPFGGESFRTLWNDGALAALSYTPSGILAAGFATRKPAWSEARNGDYDSETLTSNAPALVFWASLFGGQAGDRIITRLTAPGGEIIGISHILLNKDKAQYFSFTGRKRRGATWPEGVYRGEYKLIREIDGAPIELLSAVREITLSDTKE